MSDPNERTEPTVEPELVAYLDGELDAAAAKQFEARMTADDRLRQMVEQHRRAWELLDELPQTNVGDQFAQTTVEMVAVSIVEQADDTGRRASARARSSWLIGATVAIVAALAGYNLIASMLAAPNRQLVEDLRLLEHLDDYRAVEEFEFLQALEREGLFAEDDVDEF